MMPVKSGCETDAGSDFFDGIRFCRGDRALAVHGIAEGIDRAAKQRLADGHGEQLPGGLDFVAFLELRDVAQDDATDFVFLKIEGDANGAAGELHHLVVHHGGQAVDFGDAVSDGADVAGVLFDGFAGKLGDLLFDLFEGGAHREMRGLETGKVGVLNSGGKSRELAGNGGLIDVVADVHAEAGEERGIRLRGGGDGTAVFFCHRSGDCGERGVINCARVLDDGLALGELGRDVTSVGLEHHDGIGGTVFLDVFENARHALSRDDAIDHAHLEELAGELLGFAGVGGHGGERKREEVRRKKCSEMGAC